MMQSPWKLCVNKRLTMIGARGRGDEESDRNRRGISGIKNEQKGAHRMQKDRCAMQCT